MDGKQQKQEVVRKQQKQTVDLYECWFEKKRSEGPPKLPTPQEFCLASEEFPPLVEALHPRGNAITAFHKIHQLLKTQETGVDTFLSLKAIMNSAGVRNSGAAADMPEGQKQSITWKCEVYDQLAKLLEGYQDYPADSKGESIFWLSVFDIIHL